MIRLRRKLGLALALSAICSPALAQQDDFAQGVDLLQRGRKQEALAAFQRALAADPSNEAAYEMWKSTDAEIWTDMLIEGGEFELVAKRLIDRAKLGRKERRNDDDAMAALVGELRTNNDALERRRVINKLSAEHGEYAVPRLVRPLGDPAAGDWRVIAMHALTQMNTDVVLPLIEALNTDDAYLRRNVALVLGYIGDPRAGAVLKALAASDSDSSVQTAATDAAAKCGADGEPIAIFLQQGDDYHHRRGTVLRPFDYSDVVWSWDGDLVASVTPRAIYNNEMSKKSYYRALAVDPGSVEALAGIARAYTDMQAKLDALAESGEDVSELVDKAAEGSLAVESAGIDALDLALQWSVVSDDAATGIRISRALANVANASTDGLRRALGASDSAMSGEAAVTLGAIAANTGSDPGQDVIGILGANASREVVRIAAVIDSNAQRAAGLVAALTDSGVLTNHRGNGASGLALLNQVPGLDVILVGDALSDMTFDQVLTQVKANPVTANVPVFIVSSDQEYADLYSDRTAGSLSGADISALESVFSENLTGDRAQADALAERSAGVLGNLARSGHASIAMVLDDLASTLAGRPDAVTIPAMHALAAAGGPDQLNALLALATADDRSDEARVAAGDAIAGIVGRSGGSAAIGEALSAVVSSDAGLAVRRAAARAMGRLNLDPASRAALVESVRVRVAQ
ncbi:MAG: hypothetical protein GY711_22895 [bacterium]|nr:hypothetical protein [bacterium]